MLNWKLLRDLGKIGDETTVERIIKGTYEIDKNVDNYTKMIIENLKSPNEDEKVNNDNEMTLDKHKKSCKKQKENTGCKVTGLTFTHIKNCIQRWRISYFWLDDEKITSRKRVVPNLYKEATGSQI